MATSSTLTRDKIAKWGDTMKDTSKDPTMPILTEKDTKPRSLGAYIKYLGAPPPRTGSVAKSVADQQKIVEEVMRTPTGSQEPDEEYSKMFIRDFPKAGRKKRKTKKRKTKKRKTRKNRK
jgi:hypothetical protein